MAFKTCHRSSKLVIVVVTTYLSIYLLICFHMMLFICLILWMEQVGAGAWKNEAWSYGAMEQVWGWCDGVWLRPDFMFLFMSHPSDSDMRCFLSPSTNHGPWRVIWGQHRSPLTTVTMLSSQTIGPYKYNGSQIVKKNSEMVWFSRYLFWSQTDRVI